MSFVADVPRIRSPSSCGVFLKSAIGEVLSGGYGAAVGGTELRMVSPDDDPMTRHSPRLLFAFCACF